MLSAEFLDRLEERLGRMPESSRLAYGLVCAERMLPNYRSFSQENDWGDISPLRRALDFAWSNLLEDASGFQLERLIAGCEAVTPSTENFRTYISHGLDAAVAPAYVLDFIATGDNQNILAISSLSFDTVDMFLRWSFRASYSGDLSSAEGQDLYLADEGRHVKGHALMKSELRHHQANLEALSFPLSTEKLKSLKKEWRNLAVGNLGLSFRSQCLAFYLRDTNCSL